MLHLKGIVCESFHCTEGYEKPADVEHDLTKCNVLPRYSSEQFIFVLFPNIVTVLTKYPPMLEISRRYRWVIVCQFDSSILIKPWWTYLPVAIDPHFGSVIASTSPLSWSSAMYIMVSLGYSNVMVEPSYPPSPPSQPLLQV